MGDHAGLVLRLRLPVVASKKNNTTPRLDPTTGRLWVGKRRNVRAQERAIRDAVHQAARAAGTVPLFGGDDVAVAVQWDWQRQQLLVEVRSMGPAPRVRGRTGRGRDLANMLDTLLDALQGAAFDDDRQVARVTMDKVTDAR